MLEDDSALAAFQDLLAEHEFSISALSCHGTALHPDPVVGQAAAVNRRTILVAEKLGVETVVDFSGCPGDAAGAKAPKWIGRNITGKQYAAFY